MRIKIANSFGNVDVRQGLPKGHVHVRGDRLGQLCGRLKIKFAKPLVGYAGKKKYGFSPVFAGVVVLARSKGQLLQAIEEGDRRAADPRRIAARTKAAERRRERKAHEEAALLDKGIAPGSLTAGWLKKGEIDVCEARLIAFKAEYRHVFTDYEKCLDRERECGTPWELRQWFAREGATEEPIPSTWPEYLEKYGFGDESSSRLATVLSDPARCHPIWFMKAKLAVEKHRPAELNYKVIRDLIARTF